MADPDDEGTIGTADLFAWLRTFAASVAEQRQHLTALDSAIGDADHGVNMTRGMSAVEEALADLDDDMAIGAVSKKVGMTLVSKVGGASGPLYGTFFLRFGAGAGDTGTLDGEGLVSAMDAALGGVVARGKAVAGDKTMVDAIEPAVAALRAAVEGGSSLVAATRDAAEAAAAGRDATVPMVARKGRASYLGERSAGHMDPGAASSALLFESLASAVAAG